MGLERFRVFSSRRLPFFLSVVLVFSVAIGVGTATSVLTLARELLWRAPPYPEPERLVTLNETGPDGRAHGVALQTFLDFRNEVRSVESMAAFRLRSFGLGMPNESAKPLVVQVGLVTSDFFETLGVDFTRGRSFTEEEEVDESPVIVLTPGLYRRFGEEVLLNEEARTVVGVLPEGFRFPIAPGIFPSSGTGLAPDAYIPLSRRDYGGKRAVRTLAVVARLAKEITLGEARAELDTVATRLASLYPDTSEGFGASVVRLEETLSGANRKPIGYLVAGALALLGIVLTNVSSLFFARWAGRAEELGVRVALGASQRDLFALALTDALYPIVAGAALGLVLARFLLRLAPPILSLLGGFVSRPLTLETEALGFEAVGAGTGIRFQGELPLHVRFVSESGILTVDSQNVSAHIASPGYFESLGVLLVRGRGLTWSDDLERPPVVLVNEAFERAFFSDGDVLGKSLRLSWRSERHPEGTRFEIVGVVGDTRQAALSVPAEPQIVLSLAQFPPEGIMYVLRSARSDPDFGNEVRSAVDRIDSGLQDIELRPLRFWVGESLADERLSLSLAGTLAVAAALLAGIGIYGILAGAVTTRHREIAVRMALGASASSVRRLVAGEGFRLVLYGVGIGAAGFPLLSPLVTRELYDVHPLDPLALFAAGLGIACVAIGACWFPARTAAGTSVLALLRDQ